MFPEQSFLKAKEDSPYNNSAILKISKSLENQSGKGLSESIQNTYVSSTVEKENFKKSKFKKCLIENQERRNVKEVEKKLSFEDSESLEPFNLLESPKSEKKQTSKKTKRNSVNNLSTSLGILKLR